MNRHSPLSFTVADMTCGHCAKAITAAVTAAVPGAEVSVDLAAKRVTVGNAADAQAVAAAIAEEGYTPVRENA